MAPTSKGSIRLFTFQGINVFVHWSWLLVAAFQIEYRSQFPHGYTSPIWDVYEYLMLFVIVLLHEFGHALACRSVGGRADQIVLWPLGGVAYVDPPQRPGATLWSLAAGPLVNVLLLPVILVIWLVARSLGWPDSGPNVYNLITMGLVIDVGLFCFNMLPIYPLDGGQILRSLLWFFLGRARSLLVASVIGLVATVLLLVFAIRDTWLIIMSVFVLMNCWRGLQQARILARIAALPKREGLACPHCKTPPPIGELWICNKCGARFDTFATHAVCPNCGASFPTTRCIECGLSSPIDSYGTPPG